MAKTDTSSSHNNYESILSKPMRTKNASNKHNNKLKTFPDNDSLTMIISQVSQNLKKWRMQERKRKPNRKDPKADSISLSNRKPKTKGPAFQPLEKKVQNMTIPKHNNSRIRVRK